MSTAVEWVSLTDKILYCPKDRQAAKSRAVVFLHGFLGNAVDTWLSPENGTSFPDLIYSDPELKDYEVFKFVYSSSVLRGDSVKDIAIQLHDQVRAHLGQYELVLLAHSLGGLVAMRYVLDRLREEKDPAVVGLIMYGTPTNGSALVQAAKLLGVAIGFVSPVAGRLVGFFSEHKQLTQLQAAGEFVQELRDEWILRVVNGGDFSVPAKQRMWLPTKVVIGTQDDVVNRESAAGFYGARNLSPLTAGHIDLVKPMSLTDARYLPARQFLSSCRSHLQRSELIQLRGYGDDIWASIDETNIRDWRYDLDVYDRGVVQMSGPFDVPCCAGARCTSRRHAVLRRPYIQFGFAYENTGFGNIERLELDFIHYLRGASMADGDRGPFAAAVEEALSHRRPKEESWQLVFPKANVRIRLPNDTVFQDLAEGEIDRGDDWIVRRFELTDALGGAVFRPVYWELSYESVMPVSLSRTSVYFDKLTIGCSCNITVHYKTDSFVHSESMSRGERKHLEISERTTGNGHKASVRTTTMNDVILRGSSVDLVWQKAAK